MCHESYHRCGFITVKRGTGYILNGQFQLFENNTILVKKGFGVPFILKDQIYFIIFSSQIDKFL